MLAYLEKEGGEGGWVGFKALKACSQRLLLEYNYNGLRSIVAGYLYITHYLPIYKIRTLYFIISNLIHNFSNFRTYKQNVFQSLIYKGR